jgi:hypothetical protein
MPRKPAAALPISAARRRWLERQVASGRFTSIEHAMDYCDDQARRLDAARAAFDARIAEGDAGPFEPADAQWWAAVRAEARSAARPKSRRKSA